MHGHELHHGVKDVNAMPPQAVTATITNNPIIDRAGFEVAEFQVLVGAVTAADGSNFYVFTLQHGDAANLSDAVTVPADDLIGTPPTINAAGQANLSFRFGYRGYKRYLRLVGTETGTFNVLLAAACQLSRARHLPVP